ncbi:MAG: right-handed parallel beta-helix repeat-containing protein [Myxococcota bacterium]
MRRWILNLVLLTLATPAFATDGVLEINQTCAVQTGCFSGDTAGWPVTIDGSAGHSYRLTSDLAVGSQAGIVVNDAFVGIDLNNFAIIGSGTLSGFSGVEALGVGISVENGSVIRMGKHGVWLGDQAEVRNLRASENRMNGINVGAGSIVEGNASHANVQLGIFANNGSTVSNNTAYHNQGDGIATGLGATVQRNTMRWNSGYGLRLESQSTYRENTITFNTLGTVTGTGVNMGDNSCNGTTTCP